MLGRNINMTTLIGLGSGFALIAAAIFMGGSAAAFIDVPAFLIVFGGTLGITAASFSWEDVTVLPATLRDTILGAPQDPGRAAHQSIQLAERARREGPLALRAMSGQFAGEPFLYQAINLVIDGTAVDEVETLMKREVSASTARHLKSASMLRRAADVSPAMGLIGTLVGLVQMLGNLNDPSSIGPSMAVALLGTFYGAVLANMVFTPLAAKIERDSADEALVHSVYTMAAASIGRRENPRRLEMLINAILPPAKRVQYFD